jgi:DNA-binding MarR family transcriptional regulator
LRPRAPTPLSTLLSQVLIAFTVELDNEFERRFLEAGGGARVTSLTMWSNLLRFVGDGITVGELVAAVGLPKPTVLSRVGGVERWRYVSVGPSTGRREAYGSARGIKDEWVVQFTPAGRRAAGIWPALPGEIEARWRERFGASEMDELVGALRAVDERIEAELPEFLPVVSSTNGMALELGQQRHQGGDLTPLVLLAHALIAYTLDFEEGSMLSLPLSANVFRVLDGDGMPVRELPSRTGISKEAVAVSLTSLTRTAYVVVEGAPASKRTIRLTPAGESLRIDHRRLHARIGKRWETRFGANVIESFRVAFERILDHPELAAGLTPYPDGWRASKQYGHQTRAVLADPRGRLPHHPMVLHRGGWPDGS